MVDNILFYLFIFFYVDIPCITCVESYRILKIIYHGIISAIGNMDGWYIYIYIYIHFFLYYFFLLTFLA